MQIAGNYDRILLFKQNCFFFLFLQQNFALFLFFVHSLPRSCSLNFCLVTIVSVRFGSLSLAIKIFSWSKRIITAAAANVRRCDSPELADLQVLIFFKDLTVGRGECTYLLGRIERCEYRLFLTGLWMIYLFDWMFWCSILIFFASVKQ